MLSIASPPVTPIGVDSAKAQVAAAALVAGKDNTKVFPKTPAGFETCRTWLRPVAPAHIWREATGR